MKLFTLRFVIFLSVFSLLVTASFAQNEESKYDLLLKIGNINLEENANQYIQNYNPTEQKSVKGKVYKIVQFYNIPTLSERKSLQSLGLELIEYLPNYAYILSVPLYFDFSQLLSFNIRSISDINPEYKQDPNILDKNYPEWALRGNNRIDIMITYYNNVSFNFASSEISDLLSETIQDDLISNIQIARVNIDDIETIVQLPYVQYVEPLYPEAKPENYTGKTLHRSNVLDSEFETGRHYNGEDVKLMLQDDGIIGPHIDYEGRIGAQYLSYNSGDHGDHCAGILFGSGNLDPKTKGMASGAELYVWSAQGYEGFNSISSAYNNTGVRISSTSYGDGCNDGYTSLARTMDLQIRNFESLMHVFSCGNSGQENCWYGAGAGWGNITGGHKTGKNVIAVANLSETDNVSNSSSRGPSSDGRIKPDISAKGSSVYSTIDPNNYDTKSGTSMASPGIAGSLAQLYQAYKELNNDEEPKGGLMKALILNTADDLGNIGPDFKYGWGRVNLLKAVKLLEENRFLTDEIDENETNTHTFDVPAGTQQIKIMVYWTDKEATAGTSKALVNDLDIFIDDPSFESHLPWKLSHFPHADSLNKPAVKAIDHLNNMEQVSIDNPVAGAYTLNVNGYQVPWGPQEYYVLYEFINDDFNLTYPIGGESFKPGESVMVRWDAFGNSSTFKVEYSLDDGTEWITANENISGATRYYNWSVPSDITSKALIRVCRDELTCTSTENFNIMIIPSPELEFPLSCPESAVVKWELVPEAVSYDVFMLGDKFMEVVGSSTVDSLLVEGVSSDEEHWFSIRAVGPDNAVGRRTFAKMKSPGIWNCQFERDLGIADIISPPLGVLFDCQNYSDLNVRVELKNYGLETVDNIQVFYQFDGAEPLSEPYDGAIGPGESFIHEFSSSISLTSSGYYDMKSWIEIDNDENSANNIMEGNCKLKASQPMAINEIITFDEFSSCGYAPDCEDVICYINNKWFNLENELNDNIDWRILAGITPTPNTGPIGDHTLGTAAGKFLYLEASGDCYNKEAILMSPCADLSGLSNPGMLFWFNLNGADMGSLHIDIISNGILHKDVITPLSGNWDADWHEGIVNLEEFAGQEINFRFRAYTGNGELSDLAIDDVQVTEMTNINSSKQRVSINIFPNPSAGTYNLEISQLNDPNVVIKVVDLTGRVVYNDNIDALSTEIVKYSLNLQDINEGIYFLLLESKDMLVKEKLLKL